jgi:hypothetical protein
LRIQKKCDEQKSRAQHILSFRNPSDSIDLDRMHSKSDRHEEAPPECAGDAIQQDEEQEHVN